MTAPYGSGKTIAAITWLNARGKTAAWLTLDKTDNTSEAFIRSLALAFEPFLQESEPALSGMAAQAADPAAFLTDIEAFIIAGQLRFDALVLDNFQAVIEPGLTRLIKNFVHALLGKVRIIILSRAELPPVFNDLILRRNICLITTKELGFSPAETSEYFQMNGRDISEADVLALHSATEGWPAALNVILTISRDGAAKYTHEAREYITGFFETEIWSGLDDYIKDFLLKTCVLDTLTPTICYALTGISHTLPILRRLHASGLFISATDRESYRYHAVFCDYLTEKLHESDINENELYSKAAWWYFERGGYDRAFVYFFRSKDLYGISRTLRILNLASLGGVEKFLDTVGCITEFDAAQLKEYPVIIARIALIHFIRGDIASMHALYPIFEEWSEPGVLPVTPDDYGEFLWDFGWLSYLDPDEPTPNNQKHRDWINSQSRMSKTRDLMTDITSVLYFPTMLRGVRDLGDDGIFYTEPILKRVYAGEKNLIDLQESVWLTELLLAEFFYEQERFAEAEQLVRKVMPLVEERRLTFIYFICTAILVKIIRATRDGGEIDALASRLKALIVNNDHLFLMHNFHAFELRNRLAAGMPGFTQEFYDDNAKYEDKPYFFLIYRHFTFARALISTGECEKALVILGNLQLVCEKYKRPTDMLEVRILTAVCNYRLNNAEKAVESLSAALDWAKRYGYIRIFSDDAKDILPILEIVRKRKNDAFISSVVFSCKKAMPKNKASYAKGNDDLTKTELKILASLQAGMSYKEIALDFAISLSTVKSHAHSIYSKLGVDNRTSAILAARSAGILR